MFFEIFIIIVLLLILFSVKIKKFHNQHGKGLTVPEMYPIIGNAHILLDKNSYFNKIYSLLKKYDSPVKIAFGYKSMIFLDNPELIHKILFSSTSLNKHFIYEYLPFGKSLFRLEGNIWKIHRRFLSPAFNMNQVIKFNSIFNNQSRILVDLLDDKCNGAEFNILSILTESNLNLSTETMLGKKLTFEENRNFYNEFKTFNRVYGKTAKFITFILILKHVLGIDLTRNNDFILPTMRKILNNRETEILQEKQFVSTSRDNFIDRLIGYRNISPNDENFSEEQHLMFAVVASLDTSSLSIANTLLLLAMHPDIQEKCYKEITYILGNNKSFEITPELLPKFEYLSMTLKESLRLFSVIPFIGRKLGSDIVTDKYTLPRGSNVYISISNVHRKKEYWGDFANEFNPDNFTEENTMKRRANTYIPFSLGPRNCVGERYANTSLRITLIYLLKNYKFFTKIKLQDIKLAAGISLIINNKHIVSIERR